MLKKVISLFLSLSLIITQPIFAQGVAQLNLAQYLGQMHHSATDSFRPTQLRYFSYDNLNNSFRILLDKGDTKDIKDNQLKQEAKELMDYFLIGVTLPNDVFWVNLRPDSPDNIIDPELEKTGLGKILLEADLQLKKDTASLTSPQTPEGKAYWDKLYKKAGELFGSENITIPTITRPWIVPGEIIVRESQDSAYIYKATLKVLLEQDHLKDSPVYNFSDPRLKELNEYSSQIIRETIIPKLTQEVNSSKRYAQLRQVYYSLVLSRWFKQKYSSLRSTRASARQSASADYISRIDSGDLTNLTAKEPYDKLAYFKQYQESFAQGEYNLKEPVYTPYGQSIRSYMSGGFNGTKMTIAGVNTPETAGSAILGESLKNKPDLLPLEISGNSLQIKFTNQEQRLAIAASPLTLKKMKAIVGEQVNILKEVYGSTEQKVIEEMLKNVSGIKTKKELKEFVSNDLLQRIERDIYERRDESIEEVRSQNFEAVKEINIKISVLVSAQGALQLLVPEKKFDFTTASPLSAPEIKIKAKEAIVNAGKSLQQYMFSDEAQNKYNLSAEYIDKLETIKLWLWLENAIKFFNDKIKPIDYSPEAVSDSGRIVATYEGLIKGLEQNASATSQLIKDIYGTFRARTIKSADDAEAILRALLAMGKEEEISKEELDIAIEILSPRQVDRVIPVWKIIETIKQAMAGEIQNQEISYMQKAILDILIDDKYPGCAFLRKERLEHFLRYAKTLVDKDYLDAETVSLIETAIKEKTYGKALNTVINLSKEKMGQALPEEVAEFKRRQSYVDIDNSIPTLGKIVEAYINNKDSLLSQEDKERVSNMYTASSTASPIELSSLKRAVNLFILKMIDIASKEGNVKGSSDDVAKVRDDLEKLAEDTRKAFDNFRDGDSSLDLLDKLEAAGKRLGDEVEIFISDLNVSADQEAYKKGGIFGQYVDFLKEFKGIEISKYQEILEEIVDGLGNDYDLAAELIRHVRESLDDYKVEIASGEYAQSQLSEKEFLMKRIAVVSEKMSSEDVITEEAKLLVNAWKQHQTSVASPLTLGMVKSTIKTKMDAFNKKDGKDGDKKLKELYDGFDPISTYEELTKWIDKAKNYVEIAQKGSGMIDILENIKKEISRQEKPYSTASPLGKKLTVTDIYGRHLRYVYYWKLSDGEKNSLLEAFRKSFTEWGIKAADKNLRFAVRVNRADKIVAVVGALQYNIDTKKVGIRIVPEGVDKALEIESSLRETYIEEIRQEGAKFWDNTFSSAAGSPLVEFVTGGVNSNETIDASNKIGGTRIEEIEYRAGPKHYGFISKSGFKEILKKDNTFVLEKNLSHQRLADPLLKVLVDSKDGNESFEYNNQKFSIKTIYERIYGSIFEDKRWTNLRYIVKNTSTDETISFSGVLPYYINDYGFYGGDKAFRLEPKDIIDFFGITASSGLTSESQPSVPFGGIDFTGRAMRIGLEPMGSFADLKLVLPEVANAAAIDLDNEFKRIQLMASFGIRPSDIRILEFAAACYYRGEFGPRMGEITSCLQQAHFLDERLGRESSPELRLATMLPEVM